jgi:hypothetical protein
VKFVLDCLERSALKLAQPQNILVKSFAFATFHLKRSICEEDLISTSRYCDLSCSYPIVVSTIMTFKTLTFNEFRSVHVFLQQDLAQSPLQFGKLIRNPSSIIKPPTSTCRISTIRIWCSSCRKCDRTNQQWKQESENNNNSGNERHARTVCSLRQQTTGAMCFFGRSATAVPLL